MGRLGEVAGVAHGGLDQRVDAVLDEVRLGLGHPAPAVQARVRSGVAVVLGHEPGELGMVGLVEVAVDDDGAAPLVE
jgi:hypothetical protein